MLRELLTAKMTRSSYVVLGLVVALAMAGDHLVQSYLGRPWHWLTLVAGVLFIGVTFFAWQWLAVARTGNRSSRDSSG